MPTDPHAKNRASLGVERLEAREVPASFGQARGLSITVADVLGLANNAQVPPLERLEQYITGSGPGTVAQVRVFDQTGQIRFNLYPFGRVYSGGVYVKHGDVNGDGLQDLIVSTAGSDAVPNGRTTGRVKVYTFQNGTAQLLANFTPFGPNYTGGVHLASGNTSGSDNPDTGLPIDEIVVGQQAGGSVVKVFSLDFSNTPGDVFEVRKFSAFEAGYTGGVSVTAGNINVTQDTSGTDYAEIITGRYNGLPEIRIYDALVQNVTRVARYYVYDPFVPGNQRGLTLDAGNTDGAGFGVEIFVNLRGTGTVRVIDGFTGSFITDIRVYPKSVVNSVSMAVGRISTDPGNVPVDPFGDLVVVQGNGPQEQTPIIFPGALFSPAGLNGSFRGG